MWKRWYGILKTINILDQDQEYTLLNGMMSAKSSNGCSTSTHAVSPKDSEVNIQENPKKTGRKI